MMLALVIYCFLTISSSFSPFRTTKAFKKIDKASICALKMNFFEDAYRYFTNLNKEASAKHILIKGEYSEAKCLELLEQLKGVENISEAFSELAIKVNTVYCTRQLISILYARKANAHRQNVEETLVHLSQG